MTGPGIPQGATTPATTSKKDLHEILLHQIALAENEARELDGEVAEDRLDSIARLKKLIELGDEIRVRRASRRLASAVVVGGLMVSGILLTTRVGRVAISVEATSAFVAFHPTSSHTLLAPLLGTRSIRALGLDSITVTGLASGRDSTFRASKVEFTALAPATMSVASVLIVPRQPVRLGVADGELHVSVGPTSRGIKLELNGTIVIRGDALNSVSLRDGSAQLWYGTNDVQLVAGIIDSTTRAVTTHAGINALELFQLSRALARTDGQPQAVSEIQTGKLIFPSIDNSIEQLGPDEALQLSELEGELSAVQLTARGFVVRFRGTATEVLADNGISSRNLKPTLFSYLRARHTAVLVWTSIAWVLGTVLAMTRWWRRPSA
ncbi:MAG: hypothetical protein ABJB66_16190 [Gemmatimonadaceae bacterium]